MQDWLPEFKSLFSALFTSVANLPNIRPHNSKGAEFSKQSDGTNLRQNFVWFCTERAEKRSNFMKVCFPTLLLSNLGKSKTIMLILLTWTKIVLFLKAKCLPTGKITRSRIFFFSGRIFPPNWPEKSAKSWQHCFLPPCQFESQALSLWRQRFGWGWGIFQFSTVF